MARVTETVINVPELKDFFLHEESPNGRYSVAYRDGSGDGKRMGKWALLDGGKLMAHGRMSRPNDCKVANNGVFIINDWGLMSSLNGVFHAFEPDGRSIIKRSFAANLHNNGLSADGQFAVCHTCNSDNPDDSAVMVTFDLAAGLEIATWRPESGWPVSYVFSSDRRVVGLVYKGGVVFDYTLDGDFLDRDRWVEHSLAEGDIYVAKRLLSEAGCNPSLALVEQIIGCADVALASPDTRFHADACRLKGEAFDAKGAVADALEYLDRAIALNPKIGVKRRARELRSMLSRV